MSTRALVHIYDESKVIATIYHHHDGYPSHLGKLLMDLTDNGRMKVVNGYSGDDNTPGAINGMGNLAAYLVTGLTILGASHHVGFMTRMASKRGTAKERKADSITVPEALKNCIGGVYLKDPGASDCGEEWTYRISSRGPMLTLIVDDSEGRWFGGAMSEFNTESEDRQAAAGKGV